MTSVAYIDPLVSLVNREHEYLFKTLLLGDSAVGKSSISERYVDNRFSSNFISTIGVDFKVQSFMWDDRVVRMQLWDTAGQERFRSIVNSYYRGAQGVVLVYDVTDPVSARSLYTWLKEIEKYAGHNIPIVLAGNKADAIAHTDPETVRSTREVVADVMASYPELSHFECSAKLGLNVEDVFIGLVKQLIAKQQEQYKLTGYGNDIQGYGSLRPMSGNALRIGSTADGTALCCGN